MMKAQEAAAKIKALRRITEQNGVVTKRAQNAILVALDEATLAEVAVLLDDTNVNPPSLVEALTEWAQKHKMFKETEIVDAMVARGFDGTRVRKELERMVIAQKLRRVTFRHMDIEILPGYEWIGQPNGNQE
jgi:3-hydroxyisobutyrate dehydrogenase-like beta-hydroxyacid dehydrogenase